ncbi:hypothetical protein PAXRUDRAFT_797245 [Paxillus rubicundulus Ve08.2h10]|uniref:Uncharacterized protein n=1 Tax=Paxillus rubicundulus Ve08.2h10 TaxID=930991 RepID=A0A0D0DK41_9AGAM|nr:hypothetical protein PAXRUDRAFT_797245 [Paxillus rubicundulus Ve08.2h10]
MANRRLEWCYCYNCSLCPAGRKLQEHRTWVRHQEADEERKDEDERLCNLQSIQRDASRAPTPAQHHSAAMLGGLQLWPTQLDLGMANTPPNTPPVQSMRVPLQDHDMEYAMDGFANDSDSGDDRMSLFSNDSMEEHSRKLLPHNLNSDDEFNDSSSNSSRSDDSSDGSTDLVHDPLFLHRDNMVDSDEEDEMDIIIEDCDLPPAFDKHSAIRNGYVRAYVAAAYKGASHELVRIMLDGTAVQLRSAFEDIGDPSHLSGLETMAQTLRTVERRLGVDLTSIIVYYFLCPVCWNLHHPNQLSDPSFMAKCTTEDCDGILYTMRTTNKRLKRVPTKVLPYAQPKRAIQRWLLRPGKYEHLQHWRNDDDGAGRSPPLLDRGLDVFVNPDQPMHDMHDAWGWCAITAGLERRRGGPWTVQDIDIKELNQRFVSLPCGLVWQVNLDWFQPVKRGNHSTGALYMTCCNNPRGVRYLVEETFLVMVIPGPNEPTLDQINKIMELFVRDMNDLYRVFYVPGHPTKEPIHLIINTEVSDLPASRKTEGLASFSSKLFMCPQCKTSSFMLSDPDGFDPTKFVLRDPWRYIKYAFRSHDVDPEEAAEIFERRGVSWSSFALLPCWLPSVNSVVEFMHCVYLCLVKHLTKVILLQSGMFNTQPESDRKPLVLIEEFFSHVVWPASVSRLPPSIVKNSSSVKADQWRLHISVLFIALYVAWEVDRTIPDVEPSPSAPNTKHAAAQEKMEKTLRKRRMEALLASEPRPTPEQLDRSWARMGCHLTPYFHFAQHFQRQFLQFGPCYAIWAFPYERNNGFLGRTNHNNHKGGELECTMMRRWWKGFVVHDLVSTLSWADCKTSGLIISPTSWRLYDPSPMFHAKIKTTSIFWSHVSKVVFGPDEVPYKNINILLASTKMRIHSAITGQLEFPQQKKQLNVHVLGEEVYGLILEYLQHRWCGTDMIHADVVLTNTGICFMGDVTSFANITVDALWYGAANEPRGRRGRYAYIDGRNAVEIQWIFTITMQSRAHHVPLTTTVAMVRRFVTSVDIPAFPWDLWAPDLGVQSWHGNMMGDLEVVAVEQLSGQLILAPIKV